MDELTLRMVFYAAQSGRKIKPPIWQSNVSIYRSVTAVLLWFCGRCLILVMFWMCEINLSNLFKIKINILHVFNAAAASGNVANDASGSLNLIVI